MDPARHTDTSKSLTPGDRLSYVAGGSRKRIRRFAAPTDEAVDLLFDIDAGLVHGPAS
jgi:hypothetical protein